MTNNGDNTLTGILKFNACHRHFISVKFWSIVDCDIANKVDVS